MKKILALLLLAPLFAQAQIAAPACYAAPLGTGTPAVQLHFDEGRTFYWYCPSGIGWIAVAVAEPKGYRLVMPSTPASASVADVLAAAWSANVARDCGPQSTDAVVGRMCRLTHSIAADPLFRPANRTWRVAPNAASTSTPPTRPMWNSTGTKTVAERATVGAECDCTAPISKNGQTLCPLKKTGATQPTTNITACVLQ